VTTLKETLHEEHAEFLPHIEVIRETADGVGEVPVTALRGRIDEIHEFLAHRLIPHAVAEGRTLYPVFREAAGAPEVTVRMNRCHVELGRFTDELERLREGLIGPELTRGQERDIRRVLYGLHAIVKGHFEEEEETYRQTVEQNFSREVASEMLNAMEQAAREIRELYE